MNKRGQSDEYNSLLKHQAAKRSKWGEGEGGKRKREEEEEDRWKERGRERG